MEFQHVDDNDSHINDVHMPLIFTYAITAY